VRATRLPVGHGERQELAGQARPVRALAQEQVEQVLQTLLPRHGEGHDVPEGAAAVARGAGEGAREREPVAEVQVRGGRRRRDVRGRGERQVAPEALVRRGRHVAQVRRAGRADRPAAEERGPHATRSSPQ
jgi:hypothetical protein